MDNKANYIDRHMANRLRCIREKRGMSQGALDKAINASLPMVSKFESNTKRIKVGHLFILSQALGVEASCFFEGLPRSPGAKNILSSKSAVYDEVVEFINRHGQIADPQLSASISTLVKELAITHMREKPETPPGRKWEQGEPLLLEHIQNAAAGAGLMCMGAFHPRADDGAPINAGTLALIGNAGPEMWKAFNANRNEAPHPLDAWTHDVLSKMADDLGAQALFPFEKPYLPFSRWAERAAVARSSPLGILIHPKFGLWHAYRGALVFEEKLDLPPQEDLQFPCDVCEEKLCISTCPVGAFNNGEFDASGCIEHVHADAGDYCLFCGCISRSACPVGVKYRYEPNQARFHMKAFLD